LRMIEKLCRIIKMVLHLTSHASILKAWSTHEAIDTWRFIGRIMIVLCEKRAFFTELCCFLAHVLVVTKLACWTELIWEWITLIKHLTVIHVLDFNAHSCLQIALCCKLILSITFHCRLIRWITLISNSPDELNCLRLVLTVLCSRK
jgi:hypothetical protein